MTRLTLPIKRCFLPIALTTLLMTSAAVASDFVFGLGVTDFDDDGQFAAELEFHSDPVWQVAGADVSVLGAVVATDNGDLFIGAGVSAVRPLSNGWYLEGSFAPGYYDNSDPATDLGNDLEFRTLIGLGRTLSNGARVSVAVSHISNAGIGESNPGVNLLTLRLRY